jgi:hypothetical protein
MSEEEARSVKNKDQKVQKVEAIPVRATLPWLRSRTGVFPIAPDNLEQMTVSGPAASTIWGDSIHVWLNDIPSDNTLLTYIPGEDCRLDPKVPGIRFITASDIPLETWIHVTTLRVSQSLTVTLTTSDTTNRRVIKIFKRSVPAIPGGCLVYGWHPSRSGVGGYAIKRRGHLADVSPPVELIKNRVKPTGSTGLR